MKKGELLTDCHFHQLDNRTLGIYIILTGQYNTGA